MENLDVFESVFRRAMRESYEYADVSVDTILLVTDLEADAFSAYEAHVKNFLRDLREPAPKWVSLSGADYSRWEDLKGIIAGHSPSLIVTYRLLKETREETKYSLGAFLDTISQESQVPVLVLPDPASSASREGLKDRDSVMVVTNHLNGEHALVNSAVGFTREGGELHLCHLEDIDIFECYIRIIGQIPEINTDVARERIQEALLHEPAQYIDSVIETLKKKRPDITVRKSVHLGEVIEHYRSLIQNHEVDLLVFESKDPTQLAMHSIGYSLAVEFEDTPLLFV